MTRWMAGAAGLLVAAAAAACGQAPDPPVDPVAATEAWREKHEADYTREYVSIAALHFLAPGTHTLGADPAGDVVIDHVPPAIGRITVDAGRVTFTPAPGVDVRQGDAAVQGPLVLKEPGQPAADEIVIGDVRLVIHASGDRLALRVRDPAGEAARSFLGFSWFPIDLGYRVVGRFIPDSAPRSLRVPNTYGDVAEFTTEGVVEFSLHGRTLRLRPFTTRPARFYFVFRDASSGVETYETARFLYADLHDGGTTVLDFNQAYNPPCAFNAYTTCPIPLAENHLPVKVLAGEKAYPVAVKPPEVRR